MSHFRCSFSADMVALTLWLGFGQGEGVGPPSRDITPCPNSCGPDSWDGYLERRMGR